MQEDSNSSNSSKQQPSWVELVQQQWQGVFSRAAHLDEVGEVPSHLLCPLTMEVRVEKARGVQHNCLGSNSTGCVHF